MMKKRIALLGVLLALCIAGQVLLRPSFGNETLGESLSIGVENESQGQHQSLNVPFEAQKEDPDTENLQSQLIKQLFLMIGFVCLIGIGVWFFCKKMACNWATSKSKHISVTETVSLGPRKLIHIVQVGTKQYLLSSTPESISMLTEIIEPLNENNSTNA